MVNDFSLVHALLGMAMRRTDELSAQRLLRTSRERVRVIALSHSIGAEYGASSGVDARPFLHEVVREVGRAHADESQAQVEVELDAVELEPTQLIAAGLVLRELLTNALEHAFPERRAGVVHVSLSKQNDGEVVLRVADDGVGMAADAPESPACLGLPLVHMLAEQLSAGLSVRSSGDHGTDFSLRFTSLRESRPWQPS